FYHCVATTPIYTLSLHDALPISFGLLFVLVLAPLLLRSAVGELSGPNAAAVSRHGGGSRDLYLRSGRRSGRVEREREPHGEGKGDRKSTRLNSSHQIISYAFFCL